MLGDKLKAARVECKLTQQQVADVLGVDRSSYAYYETGKSKVTAETLQKLSVIFGVSYEDLFSGQPERSEFHSDVMYKPHDRETESITVSSLSPEERKILAQIRIIRYMGKGEALEEALKKMAEPVSDSSTKADKDE